jgi:hypothetical protein
MKRHSFAFSLALAVLAVLGLAGPVRAHEPVPFKGRLEGIATLTPLKPPFVSEHVKATGNATHLGHFTLVVTGILNTTTRTATGSHTFIAANGDKLFAKFTGIGKPTATPGLIFIVQTATVVGGTGRFAGASGSYIIERLLVQATGRTAGSINGTISSPGAARR